MTGPRQTGEGASLIGSIAEGRHNGGGPRQNDSLAMKQVGLAPYAESCT